MQVRSVAARAPEPSRAASHLPARNEIKGQKRAVHGRDPMHASDQGQIGDPPGDGNSHDEVAAKGNDFDLARNLSEVAPAPCNRTQTTKS